MGPGLFSPDDGNNVGEGFGAHRASMGPGLFSPDDAIPAAVRFLMRTELQWGRAYSARMTVIRCRSVKGLGSLQWGRAYSARMTHILSLP